MTGNTDLPSLVSTMEEVIEMTGLNRRIPKEIPTRAKDTPAPTLVRKEVPSDKNSNLKTIECYNCHEKGHRRPDCPHPRRVNKISGEEVLTDQKSVQSEFNLFIDQPEESNSINVIMGEIGSSERINNI